MAVARNTRRLFTIAVLAAALSSCTTLGSNANNIAPTDITETIHFAFPLDEYMNAIWGSSLSPDAQRARLEQISQRSEELITQCMHDAGFDYDPGTLNDSRILWGDEEGWNPTNPEWIAQWGYGIIDSPLGGGCTASRCSSLPVSAAPENPRRTPAEQKAYFRALWGPPCEDWGIVTEMAGGAFSCSEPPEWTTMQVWEVLGCQGQASLQMATESPQGLQHDDEFAPLFAAIWQMQGSLRSDITDADIDWALCMANAGFLGFERQSDGERSIWDMYRPMTPGIRPGLTDDEIRDIQQIEIETAIADFNCQTSTDFWARQNAHRTGVETQFVNDHRAALTALLDAAEQRN